MRKRTVSRPLGSASLPEQASLPARRACRPLQTLRDMMERLMDLGMVKRWSAGVAKGAAAGKAGAGSAARQVAVQAA